MTLWIHENISSLPAHLSSSPSTTRAVSSISISIRRPLALMAVQDGAVWCVCISGNSVLIDRRQPINSQWVFFFFSFFLSWRPKKRLAETETNLIQWNAEAQVAAPPPLMPADTSKGGEFNCCWGMLQIYSLSRSGWWFPIRLVTADFKYQNMYDNSRRAF